MVLRLGKILVAVGLSLLFTISLVKLAICFWREIFHYDFDGNGTQIEQIDKWLEDNDLGEYKKLFKEKGELIKVVFLVFLFYF